MASTPQDGSAGAPHQIDRTPEYEDFMNRLKAYHEKRGTLLDAEPKVGSSNLDLLKVFNHIVAAGGYDKVSEEKLAWRRMAQELGIVSTNEASTAFALKEKFYKNLAAYEISTVHGKEPPPKDILEDVTAKGAALLTRTRENFRGSRASGFGVDGTGSGDDATPVRERTVMDATGSARASRGLREAPPQRVIFQPDTGSSRTRNSSAQGTPSQAAASPGLHPNQSHHNHMGQHGSYQTGSRGPSIIHNAPEYEDGSHLVNSYQPKAMKPLSLRPVPTPSNAPNEFPKPRPSQGVPPNHPARGLPGVGFDGPNIYHRCLHALKSKIPSEQAFALNHLVKISYERGDKYRFDSFPGLAEGLVNKALEVGSLFYHVKWEISWDSFGESQEIGMLDGNDGTPDLLEMISNLVEKDLPDSLQPEAQMDELIYITEAVLTIRNMVTLPENAQLMSDFCPAKDLIVILLHLPARDNIVELKHLALDMAEQLTPYMTLESEDPLYKSLLSQLDSEDRGTILTSLRALGRISMNLEATNKLHDVPQAVLQRIVSWLLLNDDELMDACLDFLYQYTAVVPNVDNLVRSTDTESLVSQLSRLLSHGGRKHRREFVLATEQPPTPKYDIASMPEDLLQEMLKIDEPDRVHKWVKCFFEEGSNSFITQLAAWQAYQSAFVGPLKSLGQTLITPADFIRNSTSVYKDSTAQVLREPGDPQQKFIIHGIRARPRPLSLNGEEYARCMWANNGSEQSAQCGKFFLRAEQLWNHVLTSHLGESRNGTGQFDNTEKEFTCSWGKCHRYDNPTKMRLQQFAGHINSHVAAALSSSKSKSESTRPWIVPAKKLSITYEETMTVRDERNPNAAPQAAGIPLSAVLVLRNIARNVVKTDAEEELKSSQETGYVDKLFRTSMPRFFEILAENRAMSPYMSSLLDLIRIGSDEDN